MGDIFLGTEKFLLIATKGVSLVKTTGDLLITLNIFNISIFKGSTQGDAIVYIDGETSGNHKGWTLFMESSDS